MCYGYSCASYFYKPGYMKSGDPEGCKTEIKVKEQCLYICFTFHRLRRVFNNEHNVHMRVPDEDYSTNTQCTLNKR